MVASAASGTTTTGDFIDVSVTAISSGEDTIAPRFVGLPTATDITTTGFKIPFTLDEPGRDYMIVTKRDDGLATPVQVKSGVTSTNAIPLDTTGRLMYWLTRRAL
jgi:hypothetical protein